MNHKDKPIFLAHTRTTDAAIQTLEMHLTEVGEIAAQLASKIDAENAGRLIGLLHDFGKYSRAFQTYIKSATRLINPDEDEYVEADSIRGKIDHSTAGAQWIYRNLCQYGGKGQGLVCSQILAVCIASHHSGLIDSLDLDGLFNFDRRMNKADEKTHLSECIENADKQVLEKALALATSDLVKQLLEKLNPYFSAINSAYQNGHPEKSIIPEFYLGFYTRFLFSCLIDADRINSADFENPENASLRSQNIPNWNMAIERLETKLASFKAESEVARIRKEISDQCLEKAKQPQGIYTLSVPTGGGKTLASLRYAVHHAQNMAWNA